MRPLIVSTFVSLDGVMQAPGGPDEDRSNGFPFGPVVLGQGKRLFEGGARPGMLRRVGSRTSPSGAVMNRYVPDGEIPPAPAEQPVPSGKEVVRRAKLARAG